MSKILVRKKLLKATPLILLMGLIPLTAWAQSQEREAVRKHITSLFDGMRTADTTLIRSLIHPAANLLSSGINDKNQPAILRGGGVEAWLKGVASAPKGSLDEQLDYIDIRIDADRMATAWTPYRFYRNGLFSHCGVNAFQLAKEGERWFITSIIDTRSRSNCDSLQTNWQQKTEMKLNKKLDQWHSDAATGRYAAYFEAMTETSIFIGTDALEVWDKERFMAFTKPHFEDGAGWDFTSTRRAWYFSQNKEVVWFDEDLHTWMGVCRGSGVFEKTDLGWKLSHYVLSMTIPNERVNDVLGLIKTE